MDIILIAVACSKIWHKCPSVYNQQKAAKSFSLWMQLFVPFGRVDDVYIMRDEQKQSRGVFKR